MLLLLLLFQANNLNCYSRLICTPRVPTRAGVIRRMKEGIYTEYGHPTPTPTPLDVTSDAYHTQQALWQIHIYNPDMENCTQPTNNVYTVHCGPPDTGTGLATFHVTAWQGFVKKLLHAMLTNDDFYVVLGGHSAAAGHGNDFQQNRILHGFHYIMEPVMDKLGIRLLSRNMGMGGVGTFRCPAVLSWTGGDMFACVVFGFVFALFADRVCSLVLGCRLLISQSSDTVTYALSLE